MLDILQQVSSGYVSRCSSSILGVPLIISHDHTHQVLHGRPPIPCTGGHTRWCDASVKCSVSKSISYSNTVASRPTLSPHKRTQRVVLWVFLLMWLHLACVQALRVILITNNSNLSTWCDHSNTTSKSTNLSLNEINTVDHAITHTRSRDLEASSIWSYIKRTETNQKSRQSHCFK